MLIFTINSKLGNNYPFMKGSYSAGANAAVTSTAGAYAAVPYTAEGL